MGVKCPKLVLSAACRASASGSDHDDSTDPHTTTEYEKNVSALQKLASTKSPPVQELLNATRKKHIFLLYMQASGEIEVVFYDGLEIVQMFLGAENAIMEIPSDNIINGISHLMASYYVFYIHYPKVCRPTLYFFQDILMDKPDSGPRPVRFLTYIKNTGLCGTHQQSFTCIVYAFNAMYKV